MTYSVEQIEKQISEIEASINSVPKSNKDMLQFLQQQRSMLYSQLKTIKAQSLAVKIQDNIYTDLADWLHLCFCGREHESGEDCRWTFAGDSPRYNVRSRYLQIVSGLINIYGVDTLMRLKSQNNHHKIMVDFYRLAAAFYLP